MRKLAMKIFTMKIGAVIRDLRRERGQTLEDVAFAAETDASNLSRIERGRQRYTPEILERIAGALGVSVTQLYQRAEGGLLASGIEVIPTAAESKSTAKESEQIQLLNRIARLNEVNQYLLDEFVKVLLRSQKMKP